MVQREAASLAKIMKNACASHSQYGAEPLLVKGLSKVPVEKSIIS